MGSYSGDNDIIIIGAGICGLATALALHRKGIGSVVLERADSLRASGAAIDIHTNGWRALDQLGVGPTLREKANRIYVVRHVSLDNGMTREVLYGNEEYRNLVRSDLIQALFDGLPPRTVHFGCHIVQVKTDPVTSQSVLHFDDGSVATAKILIGCDGVNSIVAESLKLKPTRSSHTGVLQGLTNYPNGHGFGNDFILMKKGHVIVGRNPIGNKLVHWFIFQTRLPEDYGISGKPEIIREAALELIKGFPPEMTELAENSLLDSFTFTKIRYRAPWDLLLGNLHRGTVTVAGDAMHVMGPFLGQGGAAGLEDAVVLGRCLAKAMQMDRNGDYDGKQLATRVGLALVEYVKERRMRVTRLSMQTYLNGLLMATSSGFTSGLIVFVLKTIWWRT
ncbi:monooxygenase 1-like [Magnolia sinica]|uniref:monooxygenase 1-like n=1 Tax=Magnolia sinica TaxID=86752 RepID=UPI0026590AA5|nr:monooxygenase 1-like [Magnolia sinica]